MLQRTAHGGENPARTAAVRRCEWGGKGEHEGDTGKDAVAAAAGCSRPGGAAHELCEVRRTGEGVKLTSMSAFSSCSAPQSPETPAEVNVQTEP